jgi:EAL domain-containing protein (putative c-di-GMP-specific phosphodiesterase class I)/GGDEF domain-containing protein
MRSVSLKTLLVALLALAFLLLGALLFVSSLLHTRDFLARQLQTHAQDTATTLALQLSPALRDNDYATVTNTVDALFDSGYYRRIALTEPGGAPLLVRELPVQVQDAPQWFIRLIPLTTPAGTAEALVGWQRAAVVEVVSHPGYAYRQLWLTTRSVVLWTLALGALSALLLVWLLKRALRPLQDMERLALQAVEGRFGQLPDTRPIRELASIGQAMNRMSAAVERMLNEQRALVERLQQELYHDDLTGLFNRPYMLSATDAALAEPGQSVGLAILRFGGLAELNAQRGRAAGDELVRAAAGVTAVLAAEFGGIAGRLDGGQFAVLLDQTQEGTLEALARRMGEAGAHTLLELGIDTQCEAHVGAALVSGVRRGSLFAAADAALRDARLGPSGSHRLATGTPPGAQDLRKALIQAIERHELRLEWQPALRCADLGLDHFEAYARLPAGQGELVPAGAFVHLAEASGLIATLDELVLTHAWMELDGKQSPGAINLSATSLVSPGFIDWLMQLVITPARLRLEVNLNAVLATPGALAALTTLKQAGFPIVLDRFVPRPDTLAQLREIRPHAVKVEGALCRQAREDAGTRALLSTLCMHARELGIAIGATGVEHEEQRAALCELGFDGLQGRLYGPRELI